MKTNKKMYLTPETANLSLEVRDKIMLGVSAGLDDASENLSDWSDYIGH